jgi:hypothetical protein
MALDTNDSKKKKKREEEMVLCLLSLGFWKKMEFKKERRK